MAEAKSPDLNGANVDKILDDGASGLQYFGQLHERYQKAFGHGPSHSLDQIYALYDEQRGMNLEKLANTANAMYLTLKDADEQWTSQQAMADKLPTIWQGDAAEAAQYMFGQQLTMAADDKTKARAALDAIVAAVPNLRKAVQDKADHVKSLVTGGEVRVDDLSLYQLDILIGGTDGVGDVLKSVFPGTFGKVVGEIMDFNIASQVMGKFVLGPIAKDALEEGQA